MDIHAPFNGCRLIFWPPWLSAQPQEIFESCSSTILHPAVNARLAGFLLQASTAAEAIGVKKLTLKWCNDLLLAAVLPHTYRTSEEPVISWGSRWVRRLSCNHVLSPDCGLRGMPSCAII